MSLIKSVIQLHLSVSDEAVGVVATQTEKI